LDDVKESASDKKPELPNVGKLEDKISDVANEKKDKALLTQLQLTDDK